MTPDKEPRAEVSEVNKEELVNAAEDKIDLDNEVATELFEVVQDLEKTTGLATDMPYNCASFLLLQHNS
jgi:hypothetical protein